MLETYFVSSTRITPIIEETVINREFIVLDGIIYKRVSKKPKGKSIKQKLLNEKDQSERIILYE